MQSSPNRLIGSEPWNEYASQFSGESDSLSPTSLAPNEQQAPRASSGELWAARLSLIVFVLFCLELGLVLVVLPWTRIWTENNLLMDYPRLRVFAANLFVRGAFSGLGLVDLCIGIWEVAVYREEKPF